MKSKLWNRISFLGLDNIERHEAVFKHREIILINRMITVFLLILLFYLPVEIIFHGYSLLPIIIAEMALVSFTLLFTYYRKFEFAKTYFFFISIIATVPMMLYIPRESGNQYFLLPISLIPLLLFNKNKKIISGFLFVVFLFYAVDFTRDYVPDIVEVPVQTLEMFSKIFLFMNFLMLFFVVFYFKQINNDNEIVIHKQHNSLKIFTNQLAEKNKEVTDSINYAKRIQYSLLANNALLEQNLPEHFVLFIPKDIVSGDFYWATKKQDTFYLACCDCTGHGVPGAFMSLLNISFLNEAINEKNISEPHLVLNHVRNRLIQNMEGGQDGMDAVLVKFNNKNSLFGLSYASANNKPLLVRENHIIELPFDKMPVGKGIREDSFSLHIPELKKSDLIYFYSDGYSDQIGGPKGKKFKYGQLKELLLSISDLTMKEQKEKISETFYNWKGESEQVDDICIIGIKI